MDLIRCNIRTGSFPLVIVFVMAIVLSPSAQAQSFKKVKVAGNVPIVQVASGGVNVWALASNGHPYIFKGKSFALASSISLSQIAVGGGSAAQPDEVWALNSSGSIFRAHKSGTSWVFAQISGSLTGIAVGPGYQDACHPYEVWGLNSGSAIYRYNYCSSGFDQVPGLLCEIQVGGGDIWGADCGPDVFRFSFSAGAFVQHVTPFLVFPQLTVGPNGVVWGIDTGSGAVYRWDDYDGFKTITCCDDQIQAGGDGVWVHSPNSLTYHWNPSGLNFVQVAGSLVSLSVGSGGGVWGIDAANHVFAFSTP